MEFKDYYQTLGVPKTASAAEIKRAFRKLARQYHPDLNAGNKTAEARFKEINEANEVLSDADSRRKYDELGANWRAYEQAEQAGRDGGPSSGPFGGAAGGGRYRTMTPDEMQDMFGGDDSFSDFFHRFFAGAAPESAPGGRRGRSAQPRRGADFESPVELTLEEAFAGTTRRLRLDGVGSAAKTVEVRIPAGVTDGARVRVAGEGEPGAKGGSSGDLFLRVHISPHARFVREGADLRVRVPVPVTTAVLGGEIPVTTLSESTLRLKIPPLTANGRVFRLRGQGMPAVGAAGSRGDLYAVVEIALPTTVTEEARKLYEALRQLENP
jgi:DnaJ-class molecular chaperone